MSLHSLRQELAKPRTSIQLCFLGIIGGSSAAGVIILFRLAVEWLQSFYLSAPYDFASMPSLERFIMPLVAVLIILTVAKIAGHKYYRMGIPFVIHRLKVRYGHLPLPTTFTQFFGGIIALASGFVVGKEGPSVHLGAATSYHCGQWLQLPYNSTRILAGCGVAAGISACFNTPFAAVLFVMEVVLREYKLHIFIPVMLASACGSVLTRMVFGEAQTLSFFEFQYLSGWMYFYLIFVGFVLGILAFIFGYVPINCC
jgi:H+/Cl- antiporter ClcA